MRPATIKQCVLCANSRIPLLTTFGSFSNKDLKSHQVVHSLPCVPLTPVTFSRNMSRKSIRTIWGDHLRRLNVKNVSVTSDPYSASLSVPGLGAQDYNKFGNPNMKNVLNCALTARMYMYHMPYNTEGEIFMDWAKVTSDRLTFLSSMNVEFSKSLYDSKLDKAGFEMKIKLGYVGNASLTMITELYSRDSENDPLVTQVAQSVSIDKSTRKPFPFPDWFRDKFKGRGIRDQGLILRPFERSEEAYVYDLKVRWSDTDAYNHTNYSSYIIFAEDAIFSALASVESGNDVAALKGMTEDKLACGVRRLQISYQNESLESQALVAYVWQTESEGQNVVRCSIERDNVRVCQLVLDYYD